MDKNTIKIPCNKEERILYILIRLLKSNDYVTISKLSEELFISNGTIEKELIEIEKKIKKEGVELHRKTSKGFKLVVNENKRRKLTASFIYNFWGDNWYLKQVGKKIVLEFDLINIDASGLFPSDGLKKFIDVVYEFSKKADFNFTDYTFKSLVIHLAITIERIQKNSQFVEYPPNMLKNHIPNQQEMNALLLKDLLEEEFKIQIPKAELIDISIHLMAANKSNHSNDETANLESSISKDEMRGFICESLDCEDFDEELVIGVYHHIMSIFNRLKLGMNVKNPFVDEIKQKYFLAFDKALYLKDLLEKNYKIKMNDDEITVI